MESSLQGILDTISPDNDSIGHVTRHLGNLKTEIDNLLAELPAAPASALPVSAAPASAVPVSAAPASLSADDD